MLDIYHHEHRGGRLPAAIRSAAGRITHVQVCGNDRGAPGARPPRLAGVLSALDDAATADRCASSRSPAHNESIAIAASIWRPLAPSQDALAIDGLAFLRSLRHPQEN